ncbi:MAG: hypothetical protein AAGK22_10080 [Acidobacteriota bacterium]
MRLLLVPTALALLAPFGCSSEGEIAASLRELAANGSEFELAAALPFRWERCAFLSPYTTRARAEELLHVEWPTFSALGLESQDSFHLLACSANGGVTGFARLGRSFRFVEGTTNRALLTGSTLRNLGENGDLLLEAPQRYDVPDFSFE